MYVYIYVLGLVFCTPGASRILNCVRDSQKVNDAVKAQRSDLERVEQRKLYRISVYISYFLGVFSTNTISCWAVNFN